MDLRTPPRFLSLRYGHHRDLHSFPTRRSSDLFSGADQLVAFEHAPRHRHQQQPGKIGRGLIEHTRSEEHTSELQSRQYLVCRLLLEKKKSLAMGQFIAAAEATGLGPCPNSYVH